jgi:hypothetical protein
MNVVGANQVTVLDLALNLRRRWQRLLEEVTIDHLSDLIMSFWNVENFVGRQFCDDIFDINGAEVGGSKENEDDDEDGDEDEDKDASSKLMESESESVLSHHGDEEKSENDVDGSSSAIIDPGLTMVEEECDFESPNAIVVVESEDEEFSLE